MFRDRAQLLHARRRELLEPRELGRDRVGQIDPASPGAPQRRPAAPAGTGAPHRASAARTVICVSSGAVANRSRRKVAPLGQPRLDSTRRRSEKRWSSPSNGNGLIVIVSAPSGSNRWPPNSVGGGARVS